MSLIRRPQFLYAFINNYEVKPFFRFKLRDIVPALNETQSSEPETHPPLAENLPASALNESESFRASQKREDIVNSLSY